MRLTWAAAQIELRTATQCARHALLHMVPKWLAHWTTRAGCLYILHSCYSVKMTGDKVTQFTIFNEITDI